MIISSTHASDWKRHEDPLAAFLGECCQIGDQDGRKPYVRGLDLFAAYESWCKYKREQYPLTFQAFNSYMLAKGLLRERLILNGLQVRVWTGIELKVRSEKGDYEIVPTQDFIQGLLDYVSQRRFHAYSLSRIALLLRVTADLLPHLEKDQRTPKVTSLASPEARGLRF